MYIGEVEKLDGREKSVKISEHRSYGDVSLVKRTLAVLECVNLLKLITVRSISEACSIPPSSVVRILETLCAEGYLVQISRREGYALTSKVKSLSAGFQRNSLIVELIQPVIDGLTKEYLWPFAVSTLDTDAMVVQYSSIPLSPLAHVRSTFHKRLSLISKAHGLAYMSFCNKRERKLLLKMALEKDFVEDRIVSSNYQWRRALRQTRKLGYATRLSKADKSTNSLAVPILLEEGTVAATIGVTYFLKAVKPTQIQLIIKSLKSEAITAAETLRRQI